MGENVDIVFLNFAKAFDKVHYKRLILKMRSHGIQGKILDWITEWLKGRKQKWELEVFIGLGWIGAGSTYCCS